MLGDVTLPDAVTALFTRVLWQAGKKIVLPPNKKVLGDLSKKGLKFARRNRLRSPVDGDLMTHDTAHAFAGMRGRIAAATPKAVKVRSRQIDAVGEKYRQAISLGKDPTTAMTPFEKKEIYQPLRKWIKQTVSNKPNKPFSGPANEKSKFALQTINNSLLPRNEAVESYLLGLEGVKVDVPLARMLGSRRDVKEAFFLGRRHRKKGKLPTGLMDLHALRRHPTLGAIMEGASSGDMDFYFDAAEKARKAGATRGIMARGTGKASSRINVPGYTKKDGSRVAGYLRSKGSRKG